MSVFDKNISTEPNIGGEHITVDLLNEIIEKRTIRRKNTLEEIWNAVLWRIYEYVKYNQGPDREFQYDLWELGIKQVYDQNTWKDDPDWTELVEYFHTRGFYIRYDSLNNIVTISW